MPAVRRSVVRRVFYGHTVPAQLAIKTQIIEDAFRGSGA